MIYMDIETWCIDTLPGPKNVPLYCISRLDSEIKKTPFIYLPSTLKYSPVIYLTSYVFYGFKPVPSLFWIGDKVMVDGMFWPSQGLLRVNDRDISRLCNASGLNIILELNTKLHPLTIKQISS